MVAGHVRVLVAALCSGSSEVFHAREERRWLGSYRGRWRGPRGGRAVRAVRPEQGKRLGQAGVIGRRPLGQCYAAAEMRGQGRVRR